MMLKLAQFQPVIARVHGAAAAAGCRLVSMCDLAVAAGPSVRPSGSTPASSLHAAVGVARILSRSGR